MSLVDDMRRAGYGPRYSPEPSQPTEKEKTGSIAKGFVEGGPVSNFLMDIPVGFVKDMASFLGSTLEAGERLVSFAPRKAGLEPQDSTFIGQRIREAPALQRETAGERLGGGAASVSRFMGLSGAFPGPTVGGATRLAKVASVARLSARNALDTFILREFETGGGKIGQTTKEAGVSAALTPVAVVAAGAANRLLGPQSSGKIVNSLVKPLKKDMAYGKNPGLGVANEKIIASSLDDLEIKIGNAVDDVGSQIGQALKSADDTGVRIDFSDLVADSPIDDTIARLQTDEPRTSAALITRLKKLKLDIFRASIDETTGQTVFMDLSDMKPSDALELKKRIGNLTKFTGNPSDDEAVNKTLKALYGVVKERLVKTVPQVGSLSEHYANLLSAKIATKYRADIAARHNLLGLGTKLGGIGGLIVGAVTGQLQIAAAAALTGGAIDKALGSTAVKTSVAAALASMPTEQMILLMQRAPVLWASLSETFGLERTERSKDRLDSFIVPGSGMRTDQ